VPSKPISIKSLEDLCSLLYRQGGFANVRLMYELYEERLAKLATRATSAMAVLLNYPFCRSA